VVSTWTMTPVSHLPNHRWIPLQVCMSSTAPGHPFLCCTNWRKARFGIRNWMVFLPCQTIWCGVWKLSMVQCWEGQKFWHWRNMGWMTLWGRILLTQVECSMYF
jgi:hypothetical protein